MIWKWLAQIISMAPSCFVCPWLLCPTDPVWPWNAVWPESPATFPRVAQGFFWLDLKFGKVTHVSRSSRLDVPLHWSAICVWLNGWFQCNSISLIFFFFVETIRKFKYCIHKLHLGHNDDVFFHLGCLCELPSYSHSFFFKCLNLIHKWVRVKALCTIF